MKKILNFYFIVLCWRSIVAGSRPCDGITCPPGQICEDNVIFCITTPCPSEPGCVPIPTNPCWNVTCEKGQICRAQEVNCIQAPCPPLPICEPIEPVVLDPCSVIKCDGEVCKVHDVVCIRAPCPPIASCEPIEPKLCPYGDPLKVEYTGQPVICSNTSNICPKPYTCQCSLTGDKEVCCPPKQGHECPLLLCDKNCQYYKYNKKGCRSCECIENPCLNHPCPKGDKCILQEVQCIRAPCPPIPTCVPNCPLRRCVKNCDYYKFDARGCRTCECIDDPCKTHKCNKGEKCSLVNVLCITAPCPPIPRCFKECPLLKCAQNCDFYRYDANGCRTCECYDPCETVKCSATTVCKAEQVLCKKEPCPPKVGCVPREEICLTECPLIKCSQNCDFYRYDANGCRTCQCYDPCETVKCSATTVCKAEQVFCKKEPCPPKVGCVPRGEVCVSYLNHPRISQDLTAHTSKPPERPQSMSMLAEDSDISFQPTPVSNIELIQVGKSSKLKDTKDQETGTKLKNQTNTTTEENSNKSHVNNTSLTEEPKGRALNFTLGQHDTGNILLNSSMHGDSDLSDVSINDEDDFDMHMVHAKILAPKTELKNVSEVGICLHGGLTYENGDKIENGCDSICTCTNGSMKCQDRCTTPLFRKGKKIDDPLCFAQSTDDTCCSIMVCAGDTETEPVEYCSYKNKTYSRGDVHKKGCSDVCTCEAGGNMTCKPRCPPVTKPNDRCVEVPNPSDACCKKVLCDVTLEDNESDKEDEKVRKVISAKYINATTISLKLDQKIDVTDTSTFVEISDDKVKWQKYKVVGGGFVTVKNSARYLKLENSDDIKNIQNFESNPKDVIKEKPSSGCLYKDKFFKIGDEFNDDCSSLCVCQPGGMKCLKIQCPTYFGVDILDPNCVEWETVPPNFIPSPPNCCPTSIKCKNNGSCDFEGVIYKNWEQLPVNVTGCEKRCYCEMGKIECQNTCPPVTAHPPPNLACPPNMAVIDHIPEDDCCKYWICNTNEHEQVTDNNIAEIDKQSKNVTYQGPFAPKSPSKTLGPLAVYENDSSDKSSILEKTPKISPQENPFFHKHNNTKNNNNIVSIKPDKSKNKKTSIFVTPAPNVAITTPLPGHVHSEIEIHGNGNAEELLQFINQHPELSNYPSGSVLEIHNLPAYPKPAHNSISNSDKSQIHLVPYVVPHNENGDSNRGNLPPGFSLEQLLNEFHKNTLPSGQLPYHNNPNINRPFSGEHNLPLPTRSNMTHPGHGGGFPGPFPGYHQPEDDILVHTLEAIDPHTVRLAFMVPPVIVNLHGRVEVRYTDQKDDDDLESWELQVFAPPNDLIATPSLEFDLQGLSPNTEYKIKITITLRDIHTTHSSRIYKIKTPRELITTTLPPMIPIEPEMAITDINSTWVTVVWKKFDENELKFIDGVQIRYREIDGKIYAATPLIHRAVTSYTLEKLKPNTKYEIGIFFIPFPGQFTELHAEHMLHFTTANEVDTYGFNVTLEISQIKSQSVEVSWNGVPYPEDKYVNIYRAIYQSDSGKEDESIFKIAKRDSATRTIIMDLKPGTRYRLWLEVYLTNGKIKTSNVQDFITKPRTAPILGTTAQQDKLARAEHLESKGDYYGPLVIVAILAAIAVMSTLVLLLILVRRHNQNKAAITPPSRVSQSAYDNPTYKVEIQQETMGL